LLSELKSDDAPGTDGPSYEEIKAEAKKFGVPIKGSRDVLLKAIADKKAEAEKA